MAARSNHRGWIVLESIPSTNGDLCVDFFQNPDGGFGFEHLRCDPEDGGQWTAVGGFGTTRYDSPQLAASAALEAVSWLRSDPTGRGSLKRWITELETTSRDQ